MKLRALYNFALCSALVLACETQTLSGGANDGGASNSAADGGLADATRCGDNCGQDDSGLLHNPGSRSFGESCGLTQECAAGLTCLEFAAHPTATTCNVVGKMCTKPCGKAPTDCDGLPGTTMCFSGCGDDAVCGGTADSADAVAITVVDDPAALNDSANNPLFLLTLTEATHPYPFAKVSVSVEAVGQSGIIAPCTHDDKNANGNVDIGETLRCSEPQVDKFNASAVGQSFTVSFLEEESEHRYNSRGKAIWKPAN